MCREFLADQSSRNRSTNILHNMENLSKGSNVALCCSHEIIELNKNITSGTGVCLSNESSVYTLRVHLCCANFRMPDAVRSMTTERSGMCRRVNE